MLRLTYGKAIPQAQFLLTNAGQETIYCKASLSASFQLGTRLLAEVLCDINIRFRDDFRVASRIWTHQDNENQSLGTCTMHFLSFLTFTPHFSPRKGRRIHQDLTQQQRYMYRSSLELKVALKFRNQLSSSTLVSTSHCNHGLRSEAHRSGLSRPRCQGHIWPSGPPSH